MPKIELRDIKRKERRNVILEDIDLLIEDGEYICLLGETGAGKTTLLYLLAGLVHPNQGQILFDDVDVTKTSPEERHVGLVFERFALFPHNTVMQNVVYGRRVRGLNIDEAKEIGRGILDLLHLAGRDNALPAELSGGMRQRVGIARALSTGSKILLLDEPMGALDAKIRLELRKELRNIVKDLGLTCVHATHDIEEVFQMADRVALIQNGKIVQVGSPEELYKNPANPEAAILLGEANTATGIVTNIYTDDETRVEVEISENVSIIGRQPVLNADSVKTGERTRVVVRPEQITMIFRNEELNGSEKTLKGRVLDSKFLGNAIHTWIEIEGELKWRTISLPSMDLFIPEKDERVRIVINDSLIYPEMSINAG